MYEAEWQGKGIRSGCQSLARRIWEGGGIEDDMVYFDPFLMRVIGPKMMPIQRTSSYNSLR